MLNILEFRTFDVGVFLVFCVLNAKNLAFSMPNASAKGLNIYVHQFYAFVVSFLSSFFLDFIFLGCYSSFCSKHMYFPSNASQKPQKNTTTSYLPPFLWETMPRLNPFKCLGKTHVNGWSYFGTSQETMETLVMLSSLIGQGFYNGVVAYLIGKKKILKNTSLIYDLKLKL